MTNILFICLGNICRSCTAEEVFRTLAIEQGVAHQFHIDSAGLISYHKGELPDARMRAAALQAGYHLTHRSRPITPQDFHHFHLIAAMDQSNIERLQTLAPDQESRQKIVPLARYLTHHPTYTHIPDPYYGTQADFRLTIQLVEDACASLLRTLL